jgi:menaquinone-dependent protoporphyrinogen oxidase
MKANSVLVTYASRHGATREIAERIAEVLRAEGLHPDILPLENRPDPSGYQAVLLGTALYAGRWRGLAVRFLEHYDAILAAKPFWIFCSGPTGEGDPVALLEGRIVPPMHQKLVDSVKPREVKVFSGALDPDTINVLERMVIRMVKAPTGDFRNWDDIEAWARSVAAVLQPAPV